MRIMLGALGVAAGAMVRVWLDDAVHALGGATVVAAVLFGVLWILCRLRQRYTANSTEISNLP